MIAGAGRSIGSSVSVATGPFPSSGRPSGSTTRPSSAGPTGTRTTSPVPRTVSPASIASHIVEQDAADPVALEHLGEAELSLVEAQQLVEPDVGQPGDERDAVADLLDPADLLGLRPERGGAKLCARVLKPGVRSRCQGRLSCARSARICARSARQLLRHDEVGAVQLQAGDEGRIRLEGDLRMRAERLADQLPVALLVGRLERRRADRFERDAVRRHGLPHRVRQSPDLREEPVQEGGAHRRAVQTGDQALPRSRPQAGSPARPRPCRPRLSSLSIAALAAASRACGLLRGHFQTRGPRLLGGFAGRGQDRFAFLRKAGARPLDLGERGGRLAARTPPPRPEFAAPSRGAARSWPRPGARRTARAARPGRGR